LPSPLPFSRIAVTVPPADWFHGITRTTYELCRDALRGLGATVFEVPLDAFLPVDPERIADLIHDLRAFAPQLAFGLPYLSQALVCRLPPGRDGWRPNLFTDVLDIPTLGAWDHAPFELADQLLTPHPPSPADSATGALERLRRVLSHPRVIHWARDSSQVELTRSLGLLAADPIVEMTPALPATRHDGPDPGARPDVAFIGHFYQGPPPWPDPALNALASGAVADWLAEGGTMWQAFERRLSGLSVGQRRALRLEPDHSFFWAFVHRTVIHDAHSAHRLHLLGAAGVPVACYSNLRTDLPGVPPNLVAVPGHIPFGPALDAALARHPITVDITSPGFGHTISQKLFRGFESGGFMLVDRKPDFIAAFGELGEAVSWRDGADLAGKIDLYLAKPGLRREIANAMRDRIARDRRLPDVLLRVMARAAERAMPPPTPRVVHLGPDDKDVLARLRRPGLLGPSRLRRSPEGVIVTTGPQAWHYAAVLPLSDHHLTLCLRVLEGRAALGLSIDGAPQIVDDRFVKPTRGVVELRFEIPQGRPSSLVLRSAVDRPCRVLVTRATLHRS
jgi:hypothetical protein